MSANNSETFSNRDIATDSSTDINTMGTRRNFEQFDYNFVHVDAEYEKIAKLGNGDFGEVFKARDKKTDKFVTMKKIPVDDEPAGVPTAAIRELCILEQLKHENVVNFVDMTKTKATQYNGFQPSYYLVFEFFEHNLTDLLSNINVKLGLGEIKKIMQQLLNGLKYIHSKEIVHRDLNPAKILIARNGILKLTGFELARAFSASRKGEDSGYTHCIVWYRPPELLLGDHNYGSAVDLWGAGCIMAELWTRSAIMPGSTEQKQLIMISAMCGSITPEVWPGVESLELYTKVQLPPELKRKVKDRLKPYIKDPHACDLLDKLLVLDPSKRYDSDSALNHDFFWTDPMPCDLSEVMAQHI